MYTVLYNLPNKVLPQALPEHVPHEPEGIQAESLGKGLVSESPVRRSGYLPEVIAPMLSTVYQPTPIGIWAQIK